MHYQEPFIKHLLSIPEESWDTLWALIPKIEKADQFGRWEGVESMGVGLQMPYYVEGDIIESFLAIVQELGLLPVFDWINWAEGKKIVESADLRPEDHSFEDYCKILTVIIRGNRFNEGLVGNSFEQGLILKLLYAMKDKVQTGQLDR